MCINARACVGVCARVRARMCESTLVCSLLLGHDCPCLIFTSDGLWLLPCVGPACPPINKCSNAPCPLLRAARLALLPATPQKVLPTFDYCVHSSRREARVLGEQSQPSRAFCAPLPPPTATGPHMLHIKPAQAPGLSRTVSARLPWSWQPAGEKANSFLGRKEGHEANGSLPLRLRGASGKEAAPCWCPADGREEAACLRWPEVLEVDVKGQLLQGAFWNQRGA